LYETYVSSKEAVGNSRQENAGISIGVEIE